METSGTMNHGGVNGGLAAEKAAVDMCEVLPEGYISNVLSLTSPRDACRLSLAAKTFRSAAEWDALWERFLPSNYKDVIAKAVDTPSELLSASNKKQLFLWLSDHPLIIDRGTKSFSLEKCSGRIRYMLAARDLGITWVDTPRYWRWTSLPESRFLEVAELLDVCWLEIRGKINTRMLSPNTTYVAYLVFKWAAQPYGFETRVAEVAVGISGEIHENEPRVVYLVPDGGERQRYQNIRRRIGLFNVPFTNLLMPRESSTTTPRDEGRYPRVRGDGWREIVLGEYWNEGGGEDRDRELEMSLTETRGGHWKSGLIVEGIEIRPKNE